MRTRPLLVAVLECAAVYGLLGWAYVAVVAAVHPNALDVPIAALLPLRRDTFGIVCFASSVIAFAVLDLLGELPRWIGRGR